MMKFNKKCLYTCIFSVMLLQSTTIVSTIFAAANINTNSYDNKINYNNENLKNIKSTKVIKLVDKEIANDLYNINKISQLNSINGFEVNDFAGLRSFNKKLILTDKYGWFKIFVKNTGSEDIKISIGNYVYTVPAHKNKNITNPDNKKWKKGTYTIGFTCGGGMYGSVKSKVSDKFTYL